MKVVYRGKPDERIHPIQLPDGSVVFIVLHPERAVKLIDSNGETVAILAQGLSK